jgi:hypothetical protein
MAGVAEGLAGLAALAAVQQQFKRSARLFGSAAGMRERGSLPTWPAERFEIARYSAMVSSQLSPSIFDRHWRAGQELSIDEALAYAGVEGM